MQRVTFIFFILISTLLLIFCAKEKQVKSVIQEKNLELQVLEAYEEGLNSLKRGDVLFAAKKFNEAGEGLEVQEIFELLRKCVVNVFDKDQVYNDFTPEELNAFLEGLGQNQFLRISDFFQKVPKVRHKVSFKCAKCGEPVEYNLEGLMDFFL